MTKAETLAKEKENQADDFQKDLSINKFRLDEECLSHSGRYAYYAEASAIAKNDVTKAKDNLELVEAERYDAIKKDLESSGVKTTIPMLEKAVLTDSEVLKAKENLREKEEISARLAVAVSAFEHRKAELDNLVKLYCAGYYSTPCSNNGVKNDVNEMTEKSIRKQLNNKE